MRRSLLSILISLCNINFTWNCFAQDIDTQLVPGPDTSVVQGNTKFGQELFVELSATEGNFIFSPFSISTALAMTYTGARGNTEKQFCNVLHFDPNQKKFHGEVKKLRDGIMKLNSEEIAVNVANALWGESGMKVLDEFQNTLKVNYGAGLQFVNFAKETEKCRKTINAWCEKETKEKIKELLKPGSLDASTALVLTNAIYFRGNWAVKFDTAKSYPGNFYVSKENFSPVVFMKQKAKFNYYEDSLMQAVEITYSGNNLSMIIFLPVSKDGIKEVEKALVTDKYNSIISAFQSKEINLSIPRFTFTSEFELGKVLSKMGMSLAFTGAADFSGITGGRDLHIDKVIHKAYIEVNEEGTEAAAATAVVMTKSLRINKEVIFKADHPFIFFIRNKTPESVLFSGRFINPGEKK